MLVSIDGSDPDWQMLRCDAVCQVAFSKLFSTFSSRICGRNLHNELAKRWQLSQAVEDYSMIRREDRFACSHKRIRHGFFASGAAEKKVEFGVKLNWVEDCFEQQFVSDRIGSLWERWLLIVDNWLAQLHHRQAQELGTSAKQKATLMHCQQPLSYHKTRRRGVTNLTQQQWLYYQLTSAPSSQFSASGLWTGRLVSFSWSLVPDHPPSDNKYIQYTTNKWRDLSGDLGLPDATINTLAIYEVLMNTGLAILRRIMKGYRADTFGLWICRIRGVSKGHECEGSVRVIFLGALAN